MNANEFLATIDRSGGKVSIERGRVAVKRCELPKDLLMYIDQHNDEIVALLRIQMGPRHRFTFKCRTCSRMVNAVGLPGRCRCSSNFWSRTGYTATDSKGREIPIVPAEIDEPKPKLKRWICERCREGIELQEIPNTCIRCGSHKFALESWWRKWIAS